MAPKKVVDKTIAVPEFKTSVIQLTIEGTSPLVIHPMTPKARKEMLSKKLHKKEPRKPCDPEREYLQSFYWMEDLPFLRVVNDEDSDLADVEEAKIATAEYLANGAKLGIPAVAIKAAAVRPAKHLSDLDMTSARGMFFVRGEYSMLAGQDLIRIDGSSPVAVEHVVSVRGGGKDLRYRPMFQEWKATFEVEFASSLLTTESVIRLFEWGGTLSGICEGRPEKSSLGWGRFRLTN